MSLCKIGLRRCYNLSLCFTLMAAAEGSTLRLFEPDCVVRYNRSTVAPGETAHGVQQKKRARRRRKPTVTRPTEPHADDDPIR